MSSIVKIIQVLTVGAGSNSAKAIFEVQTNDSTPKRILLSRNSVNDPQVYHMDHADINAIGIFPTEVVAMYENTWPVGLVPSLGVDGQLPDAYNAQFTQADFATGKVGIVAFNGYNYQLGSFLAAPAAVSANAVTPAATATEALPWYDKPLVKSTGYLALAAGAIVLMIAGIRSIFKKN
jgi:hypothetical protein